MQEKRLPRKIRTILKRTNARRPWQRFALDDIANASDPMLCTIQIAHDNIIHREGAALVLAYKRSLPRRQDSSRTAIESPVGGVVAGKCGGNQFATASHR